MSPIILEFTHWKRWRDRGSFWNDMDSFPNKRVPGVYAIAETDDDLSGNPFSLRKDIVYFGMTHSKGGIKSRLDQFDNSILDKQKNPGHGGADRMKYKHRIERHWGYEKYASRLFVSIFPIKCDVESKSPGDLRKKGDIRSLEYECFAQYSNKFHVALPEFNDHDKSPKKYSLYLKDKYKSVS
jgi:hypothetical protein